MIYQTLSTHLIPRVFALYEAEQVQYISQSDPVSDFCEVYALHYCAP